MGLEVTEDELDLEMREMLDVWLDFEEFGVLPWDRNVSSKDIIPYYKNGLRYINQMRSQAKSNMQQNKGRQVMKVDSDLEPNPRRRQIGR